MSLPSVPLTRRLHRLPVIPLLHGRLAREAWSWDRRDQLTREWWPQGITWAGPLCLVSWYAKSGGSRVSVVSLSSRRYAHVTLLDPAGAPLLVHAGGIAWVDDWLYVGATARGFWSLHVSDLAVDSGTWRARDLHAPPAPSGGNLRWSFLDTVPARGRAASASERRRDPVTCLIGGEYGRGKKSTRLFSVPMAAGAPSGPVTVLAEGPRGMQGATASDMGLVASVSHGPWVRGSLHLLPGGRDLLAGGRGASAASHETRGALPIGVEDLTRDDAGHLWTVAEHPGRRAIVRLHDV